MRRPVRWVFVELTKLVILLAVFISVQDHILETHEKVNLQTGLIANAQQKQSSRLEVLQHVQETSRDAIEQSVAKAASFERSFQEQHEMLTSEREQLVRLVDDRDSRLKDIIERGIDRAADAAQSSSQRATIVQDRVSRLERSILRSPTSMKQRMIYPVVQLRGNGTVGSGVVVYSAEVGEDGMAETYIFTAYHVVNEILEEAPGSTLVKDCRFHEIGTDMLSEEARTVEMIAFHSELDIAILLAKLEQPWPYVATLATESQLEELEVFDSIYAVGCPLGNKPLPSLGEITAQDKVVDGHTFWMINAPTFFGNSGGGIYLVDGGEMIGVSSMIYTYGKVQPAVVPHMGLFIPLEAIGCWLRNDISEELYCKVFREEELVHEVSDFSTIPAHFEALSEQPKDE